MKRERELKTKLACRSLDKVRKKWITPQLIVLVRGKPEEGVLSQCKSATSTSGYYGNHSACYQSDDAGNRCGQICHNWYSS